MIDQISKILQKEEREVVLNITDADDEWSAYCSSPKMMKKFEKAGWKCIKEYKNSDGLVVAKTYAGQLNQIAIKPRKEKKELTEEQLKSLKERAALMRSSKDK